MEDLIEFNSTKRRTGINAYYFVISILLILIALMQLFSISKVQGQSMRDTIQSGDFIVCIQPFSLKRGDIVTADVGNYRIVKRLIGMPGDRLVFKKQGDGYDPVITLYIDKGNGFEEVGEDYIKYQEMRQSGFSNQKKFSDHEYNLYEGEIDEVTDPYIIVLGENEYFLMGDNRDESKDSRHYGKFDRDKIIGKVVDIVYDNVGYSILSVFYSILEWFGL